MQGQYTSSRLEIVNANLFEERQRLMMTCQLQRRHLHVGGGWIKATHLKAGSVRGFSGVHFPGVDQNDSTWLGNMLEPAVDKGLITALDQADHEIVMAMARVGMFNIVRVQKPNIELGIVPEICPFFLYHGNS